MLFEKNTFGHLKREKMRQKSLGNFKNQIKITSYKTIDQNEKNENFLYKYYKRPDLTIPTQKLIYPSK